MGVPLDLSDVEEDLVAYRSTDIATRPEEDDDEDMTPLDADDEPAALTGGPAGDADFHIAAGEWVVLVYGVREDGTTCQCSKGPVCTSSGKHPIGNGWQKVRASAADAYEWFQLFPGMNVGLLSGVTGWWVLDVDGEAGMNSLKEIMGGQTIKTRTYITGSGGLHLILPLPDDPQIVLTGNCAGILAPGLDIRTTGGFIVAPPSVSAKGPYSVSNDGPIARIIPDKLEEKLAIAFNPAKRTSGSGASAGPRDDFAVQPDYDGPSFAELPEGEQKRLTEWTATVMVGIDDELRSLKPRSRNIEVFKRLVRLIEIAVAPWSPLSLERAYDMARDAAPITGGDDPYTAKEFDLSVERACWSATALDPRRRCPTRTSSSTRRRR